jgi:hypothetical protein
MDDFQQPGVKAVFDAYPEHLLPGLLNLRRLIFSVASTRGDIGPLTETLKWGQPSYLTSQSKSGTTVRIDQIKPKKGHAAEHYGLFVHCSTTLVSTWRDLFDGVLSFEGNRCIRFATTDEPPEEVLRHCIDMALTYHLKSIRQKRTA